MWRRRGRGVGAMALAALLAALACGRTPEPPDLVVILVDTLRRDHVGAYGYARHTTPFLDALATRGTVFEHAVAQAPWTGASMASLWTSRYPSEVGGVARPGPDGVRELGRTPIALLRRDVPTLAERLREAGYDTRAFVANGYAGNGLGLLRGFDVVVEQTHDARALVEAALASLADSPGQAPLLLYLHFRDVHEPTWPPEPYRAAFAPDGAPLPQEAAGWLHGDAPDASAPEVQAFRRQKIALYDASLHYVDEQVGRLAQGLMQLRRGRPFVFALASDHGEAFFEHGEVDRRANRDPRGIAGIGHGHSLFGEVTDVPLFLSGAGVPRGRDARLVRNVDLAPTLLALAGARPIEGARGIDLLAPPAQGAARARGAFSEGLAYGVRAWSLESGGFKLIRYATDGTGGTLGTRLLFDRRRDARERDDVFGGHPEQVRSLGARLDALEAELRGAASTPEARIDDETREALRALGYGR